MQKITKSVLTLVALALTLGAGISCGAAEGNPPAESNPPAGGSRAKTGEIKPCIECHEQYYTILDSKHFVKGDPRTPGAKARGNDDGCSNCHGDTSKHQLTPRVPGLIPVAFGAKKPAGPQNEACLNCHQSGARIHWQGSAHERTQQPCASCHKAHVAKDPVMVAETQANVCFSCHKDRRAEMLRVSTHPLKTGFFACSSCHASHGSTASRASLVKHSVNDTCYQCHADKRGPFLWEHPSAKDDCTHCHNPHGTNTAPMLKVRAPYLCQQCHMNSGHPSTAYSATTFATAANADRVLGKSCVNCHAKIHGSNHPSGARLHR